MRHSMRITTVAIIGALAIAACGGGGGGGGGASVTSDSSGDTTLNVQETAGVPSAFVAFGQAKGFFTKHKLKINLQSSQGGATAVPSLVSGKIQVAGSNVVSLLIAASKGLPVEAIAPGTSAHGAGQKDFGALMVPKGSPIRDVKQLAGKTVAVNTLNNIAEVVVKASLQKSGVDPSQVKLREIDFPEMGPALAKKDVDAAFLIEPFVTRARQAGDRVIDYSYVTTEPNLQVGAYAVSRQFAKENPEAVKRYRAAVGDTAKYLMAHQSQFRTFLAKRAETPVKLAKTMELPTFTTELNTASLRRTAGLVQRFGLVKGAVQVDKLTGGGGAS
jgi:NitT/TauT family transport system substrate-binding protein